jgi:hypothetical protein
MNNTTLSRLISKFLIHASNRIEIIIASGIEK